MQKRIYFKGLYMVITFIFSVCLTACVNNLYGDEEIPQKGTIPISFTGKVSRTTCTRVTDNALELNDEIGLIAMVSGTSIIGHRYIDNLLLRTSAEHLLIPAETVYYPDGENANLDFIAYYPYRIEGIPSESSQLEVTVQSEQYDDEKWDQSDFLVATKSKVVASNNSVALTFKHKMAKVKVELAVQSPEKIDELLAANPSIMASGFYTQATYDFISDKFSNQSVPNVIHLSGEWKKSNGKLIGKEMIVVPQTIDSTNQFFALEVNGKMYTCRLSASTLNSNSQRVITIRFNEVEDKIVSGIIGEVQEWGEGAVQEEQTESSYEMTEIQTALLTFNQSNIYRLYHDGKVVAEVCKEYLRFLEKGIDSQALVVYPVKNGEVDLSQGTVLQLLDVVENVHGGRVNWNVQTNTAQYIPGTSAVIKSFYIDENGNIVLEKPKTALSVHVKSYQLRDVRGSEITFYPVVKIATQYWMQKNLKTDKYEDGKPLKKLQSIGNGAGFFITEDGENIFYSGETLLEGNMAPEGWRIPKVSDWDALVAYVGNVGALKAGKWSVMHENEVLGPVTNRSFFNGYPVGVWIEAYYNKDMMVGFWSLNEEGTQIAPKTFYLVGQYADYKLLNTMQPNANYYKSCSLRCLRK